MKPHPSQSLAYTLRERREFHRYTLKALSARVKCTPLHLGNIERGSSRPSGNLLAKLCECLGIELKFALALYGIERDSDRALTELIALRPSQSEIQLFRETLLKSREDFNSI